MNDYSFIDAERASYPVTELCYALEVAPSGYYAARYRKPGGRQRSDQELVPKIRQAFLASRKTYGSPRIHQELIEDGEQVGRHRVARLMRENDLDARPKTKFRHSTTDSNHDRGYAPNLLKRDFVATAPNKVWVGDVTYVRTDEGWVYLASFTDLFARRVVGFYIADHKRDELSIEALRRAFALRNPIPGLIVHSDRGSEFASHDFRKILKDQKATQSMSRKANCWDNAVAESFFATVEKDVLMRTHFRTKRRAIAFLTDYIQNFYNPIRRHSFNGGINPEKAERKFASTMEALAA